MTTTLFPRNVRGTLRLAMPVAMTVAIVSCGGGQSTATLQIDENAFIQLALQATCADIKNRLYVVDQVVVLSDRAGSCPDASFAEVLYGRTVNDVFCTNQDSIAGPVKRCDAVAYQSMFDTMISNLAQPDLGLGPMHSIKVLLK
jgi:hypothetical protein